MCKTKRDWIAFVKKRLAAGDIPTALHDRGVMRWVAAAIKVPRKRTSINARSKDVENRVAKYLFGEDAWRTWKDREDIRNDDLQICGEVKTVDVDRVWLAGGPEKILEDAYEQVEEVIQSTPELEGYMGFAVLAPVGTKIEHWLVYYRTSVEVDDPHIASLERFRSHIKAGNY